MTATPKSQLAEELVRRLVATLRAAQLYSRDHALVARNLEALMTAVQLLHSLQPTLVIGIVGEEVVVDERPVAKADTLSAIVRRLKQLGIERIAIDRGVSASELSACVHAITTMEAKADGEPTGFPELPHVRVGRTSIGGRIKASAADAANFKRMYNDAVSMAQTVWDSASAEGQPDATAARTMIDGLAQAVAQNRTALLALTTLKNYDNYTFTHMVNVSILTMAQARALGVDGPLLREFGLAALMHDIGKIRTPLEILNKPDKLDPAELAIMRRHTVDGAEILRSTPEIPTLAPVVAFEHHLRLDGSGYPAGVVRGRLNLGTTLCSIADVYDAMRSQRAYQKAFPSDRVLAVLRQSDGHQFDQHLVRRFTQLIGIYPVGNLVRLDTGEIAVVTAVYAPDPYRPQVRILLDAAGTRVEIPYDVNLWARQDREGHPTAVAAPVDPAELGVDPLSLV